MTPGDSLFGMAHILAILPHRPPFLFVDRVVRFEAGRRIVTERDIKAEEPHFAGHFPGQPIMPGVLITDALAQTCGLLLGLSFLTAAGQGGNERPGLFLLGAANMKFPGTARPGETLRMRARTAGGTRNLHSYAVDAMVGRTVVAEGALTLALKKGAQ